MEVASREKGAKLSFVLAEKLNLANYYRLNGDYEQSKQQIDEIRDQQRFKHEQSVADYLHAQVLCDEDRFEEAKSFMQEVLQRPVYANERLSALSVLLNRQMAICHFELEEYEKSSDLFKRTLQDLTDFMGELHPKSSMMYRYLGVISERQNRYSEAIEHYQRAYEISVSLYGVEDPASIEALITLGMTYMNVPDKRKHVRLVKEAVELSDKHLSDAALTGHKARFNLAVLCRMQKRFQDATPLLTRIMESQSKVHFLDRSHKVFNDATNELASNYMFRGDDENAEIWFEKLFDNFRNELKDDPNQYASFLVHMTTDLNKYGIHSVAEKALLESLAIRKKIMPGHWLLDNTRSVLGETRLLKLQESSEPNEGSTTELQDIETLMLNAFEAMIDNVDSIPKKYRKARLLSAAQRLIRYYAYIQDEPNIKLWQEKLAMVRGKY